jgi:hypothetical protein
LEKSSIKLERTSTKMMFKRKNKKPKLDESIITLSKNIAIATEEILKIEPDKKKAVQVASSILVILNEQKIPIEEIHFQVKSLVNVLLNKQKLREMINKGLKGVTKDSKVYNWDLLFNSINANKDEITGVLNG